MQETWVWSLGWEDYWRKAWQPTPVFGLENSMDRGAWRATYSPWGPKRVRQLNDFHLPFSLHPLQPLLFVDFTVMAILTGVKCCRWSILIFTGEHPCSLFLTCLLNLTKLLLNARNNDCKLLWPTLKGVLLDHWVPWYSEFYARIKTNHEGPHSAGPRRTVLSWVLCSFSLLGY